jgi:hypothetical protein
MHSLPIDLFQSWFITKEKVYTKTTGSAEGGEGGWYNDNFLQEPSAICPSMSFKLFLAAAN